MNNKNKYDLLAVSLFWISYLLLCIYFYVERSTYADNSYYLFEIIQKKSFCIQYARYSAALIQCLPLLAVKLNLSLNAIMLAYTISPAILYFGIFLFIRYLVNDKWISYIFLATISLTIHDSFFYVNDELNQTSGFLVLMIAILRSEKLNTTWKVLGLFVVIGILQFAHLFLVLAACAILFIYFIGKKQKIAIVGLCFVVFIILLKVTLLKGGRDGSSIDSLNWRFITLRNLHSSNFAVFFTKMILTYYLPAIVLMVVLWIINKINSLTQLLTILSFVAFYILLVVFLRNSTSEMYNDKYLSILFLLFWTTIASFITDEKSNKPIVYILFFVAILYSFTKLYKEEKYTKRIEYLTNLMQGQPAKQIYLYENMPKFIQIMSWSVPYETLFISSIKGETKTILIKEAFYKIEPYLSNQTKFFGAEWTFPYKIKLNERYFPLKDEIYVLKK